MFLKCEICAIFAIAMMSECQRQPSIPISPNSFRLLMRSLVTVPKGRSLSLSDTRVVYYKDTKNKKSYHIENIHTLLKEKQFDLKKPTVLYIHGYVESITDENVNTIVLAYSKHGGFNILVLDWSNLAFGNYFNVLFDIKAVGDVTGKALLKLLKGGLEIGSLHIVGHSLGAHVAAGAARYLKLQGYMVPRVTGLDPAYLGFYPPLLTPAMDPEDASFVDVIHTDGGLFGSPTESGHADFWPNEGTPIQPGCPAFSLIFTIESLCSHWRSWRYWAESVVGGDFFAKKCTSYDAFLRGNCTISAKMGLNASPELRGNFYLRTGTEAPFALGERGAL